MAQGLLTLSVGNEPLTVHPRKLASWFEPRPQFEQSASAMARSS